MQANKYAPSFSSGQPDLSQRAGAMQAAENSAWFLGYVLCMKSLVRPSQRVLGRKEHAHFLSGNIGKYFKVTREQDYFLGNMDILKIAFREQGNMANYF